MTGRKKVHVKVPGSTANLGPGFDTLGMALDVYTWVEMSLADTTSIKLYGGQLEGIPTDKNNLVYQVAQQVFQTAGVEHPELHIAMYSEIPLTRGLGSSASAIVGGMVAANALIGNKLSKDTLFQMASALEEHPDNVGASLFGGLVVAFWDGERAEYVQMQLDDRLEVLVVIPEFQLATEKARSALPKHVSLQDAVFNISHASLLVAALATGKFNLIQHAMKDVLHQPYRCDLIPGMSNVLNHAVEQGALGIALSGAGPTLLALVDKSSPNKAQLEQFLKQSFAAENIEASTMWLKPCEGAQVLTHFNENDTLIDNVKGEVSV